MRKIIMSLAAAGALLGLAACNDTATNNTSTVETVTENVQTIETVVDNGQANSVETIVENTQVNSDDRIGVRERTTPTEQ